MGDLKAAALTLIDVERLDRLEENVERILQVVELLQDNRWELIARQETALDPPDQEPLPSQRQGDDPDLLYGFSKSDESGELVDGKWYPDQGRFISYERGRKKCILCSMWATRAHMESSSHRSRTDSWFKQQLREEEAHVSM